METQAIFSNFLAHEYLNLNNDKIAEYCLSEKQKSPGIVISNEGGWHSDYLDLSKLDPVLQPLFENISKSLYQLQLNLGFKADLNHIIDQAWINVNGRTNANRAHKHTGGMFSGVYYVKYPKNSGEIEFTNPIQDHPHVIQDWMLDSFNAVTSMTWKVTPEEGKLLVFPSWLIHYVYPSQSDENRISIAFNSKIV